MSLTVRNIIRHFLAANGYDGLYHPAQCACTKDVLLPCGEVSSRCSAGYFRPPGEDNEPDADVYIGPIKAGG
jgi:hypothetical protein